MMGDVMENLIGLGVSLAYVLAVLGASSLAARRGASSEATRKFVHIALGGWWLIGPGSSIRLCGRRRFPLRSSL